VGLPVQGLGGITFADALLQPGEVVEGGRGADGTAHPLEERDRLLCTATCPLGVAEGIVHGGAEGETLGDVGEIAGGVVLVPCKVEQGR